MATCEMVTRPSTHGDHILESNGVVGGILLGGMGSITEPVINQITKPATQPKASKPRTKQYTPNMGTEGFYMHQAILQLHQDQKPITVGSIQVLCAAEVKPGDEKARKVRVQRHVQGMLKIGVLARVATGVYSLVEGK